MCNNHYSEFNDKYYLAKTSAYERRPDNWGGRLTVFRKDSEEVVGGIQCNGQSSDDAIAILRIKAQAYFESLPRPPYEWERVTLRQLLVDYREFNNKLTQILVSLEKLRARGDLSDTELHRSFWSAREQAIEGGVVFSHRLATLSEKDLIDLMTSDERVYQDQTNPWHLEDMDGRAALFKYITNPSEKVVAAHKAHLLR